jgi:hypothetical protein
LFAAKLCRDGRSACGEADDSGADDSTVLADDTVIEDEDGAIDEWLDAQTEAVDDVPDIEDIDADFVEDEAEDD